MFPEIDFPQKQSIYLDSASTSLTPHCVLSAMHAYYSTYRASIHRGMFVEAVRATDEVEQTRARTADFIDAQQGEIIFTSSATHASQLLISTLEANKYLHEGNEILITQFDHHATCVPLREYAHRVGAHLVIAMQDTLTLFDEVSFLKHITPKTKIISLIHGSNVTGTVLPIASLVKKIRAIRSDIFILCDASQTAGHTFISCKQFDVDALFFSAHKMCGPTGLGILFMKETHLKHFRPPYAGGGAVYSVTPEETIFLDGYSKFEAGTLPIAEIIGFGATLTYIDSFPIEAIQKHIHDLCQYLTQIMNDVPQVHTYTSAESCGSVAITIDNVHPHDIAHILAKKNIAVRPGFQCAELLTRKISPQGIVRASVYGYTTKADIDALRSAIVDVITLFKK